MFSFFGLYAEEQSYHQYAEPRDIRKLVIAAILEPFLFHPIIFVTAIQGLWEMLRGKEGWAEMKKEGFSNGWLEFFPWRKWGVIVEYPYKPF